MRDRDVYVVPASGGSAPVKLGRGTSPAWAPDGSEIAVVRNSEVYLLDPAGSGATLLTSGLEADSPDWSPDGSKIAVESTAGPSGDSRIVVLDADGTDPDIELPGPGDDFTPSWSPDGSSLVFTSITLDADLVVVTLDGSRRDLVTGSSYDLLPAWSPCPPEACPSPTPSETPTATPTEYPTDERKVTRTLMSFQNTGRRIKVAGAVEPPRPGARVRVVLWRKKGGRWARVARKRPLMDDEGIYRTRFRRPFRTRRCRLRARFPGDAAHLPSRRTQRFRC